MDFTRYLAEQYARHPSSQPRDIIKQCYQAAYGAEHLLGDMAAAMVRFDEELASAPDSGAPLFEQISRDICRVNLAPWRMAGLPGEWLFKMFAMTAGRPRGGDLRACLNDAGVWIRGGGASFSPEHWAECLAEYEKSGMEPVHHSDRYRSSEHPAYRLVHMELAALIPLLIRLAAFGAQGAVVALDGRCASGKTTAAARLSEITGGAVIHMDDFFLPPELRTPERLAEPGGNVHYERFLEEALPFLASREAFSYRIFDCGNLQYDGRRQVEASLLRIVEGSYSCHPVFGGYADIRVFSDVSPDEQMSRIVKRDGPQAAESFRTRWIPMEERYFSAFDVKSRADVVLN